MKTLREIGQIGFSHLSPSTGLWNHPILSFLVNKEPGLGILLHVNKYMYVYTCMHVCMYACMNVWMYVCMFLCMYVWMYDGCNCMSLFMYVCIYVFMHLCIYLCMYVCIYVFMYFMVWYGMDASMHVCMYNDNVRNGTPKGRSFTIWPPILWVQSSRNLQLRQEPSRFFFFKPTRDVQGGAPVRNR